MKNILVILIFIFGLNTYSQTPIFFLENRNPYETEQGAYYKDLNNVLDNFEGTWLYTNGTTSLKIVLEKKTMFFNGDYYEDFMIGEYQYIENGVEKINTLSDLSQNLGYDHKITGNLILRSCYFMPVSDCIEGEGRLRLGLIDAGVGTNHWARMILKRRVINGQQAIKAYIVFNYAGDFRDTGGIVPDPTLPWQQEYVMLKQ